MAEVGGDAAPRWESLVADMLADGAATYGNQNGPKRAFGSTSLKTGGKIFAMLVKDRLVVKLPATRVEQLVADGIGERFDPGHGRIQKEWLSVHGSDPETWRTLAHESEAFVARRAR
jgi:TfoX/Sxy family transcriptional regulator of competence genes